MKAIHPLVSILVIVLIAASTPLLGGQPNPKIDPSAKDAGQTPHPTQNTIQTSRVIQRIFTNEVPWMGTVESQHAVRIKTTIAGQIVAISAQDEMPVKKGAPLFDLGGSQVDARLTKLKNDVDALKEQISSAKQTENRTQKDVADTLATKDQLAAVHQAVIKTQAQLRTASKMLASLQTQSHIVAPIAGTFTGRRVSAGQLVHTDETLAEIMDTTHLRIKAFLYPPAQTQLIDKQASVTYGNGKTVPGTVRRIVPAATATGATAVWIEGSEIDSTLRPGMNVSGNLILTTGSATLAVPKSAVIYDEQETPLLFVRNDDGTYERRNLQIGQDADGWTQIISGIKANETIVLQGAHELLYRHFTEQFKVRD